MFGLFEQKFRNKRLKERQRVNAPWPIKSTYGKAERDYVPQFQKRKPMIGGREEALLKAARLVLDDTPADTETRIGYWQALREAVRLYKE